MCTATGHVERSIVGATPAVIPLFDLQMHAVCIDTWVYGKAWLTCLDVGSGKYWQANQRREAKRAAA
jgi:hypothetical protein